MKKVLTICFEEKKGLFGKTRKSDLVIGMDINDEYHINYEDRFVAVSTLISKAHYEISNYDFMNGKIISINERIVKNN